MAAGDAAGAFARELTLDAEFQAVRRKPLGPAIPSFAFAIMAELESAIPCFGEGIRPEETLIIGGVPDQPVGID